MHKKMFFLLLLALTGFHHHAPAFLPQPVKVTAATCALFSLLPTAAWAYHESDKNWKIWEKMRFGTCVTIITIPTGMLSAKIVTNKNSTLSPTWIIMALVSAVTSGCMIYNNDDIAEKITGSNKTNSRATENSIAALNFFAILQAINTTAEIIKEHVPMPYDLN